MPAAIVCNGELDKSLKEEIEACKPLIAVDGGLNHCATLGLIPDWIIGDFDSVEENLLCQFPVERQIKLPRAKDKTDLELALERIEAEEIFIFGGLGGRLDHVLTHFFILLRKPLKLFLKSPYENVFAMNSGKVLLPKDQTLFLYPLNGPSTLFLNGDKQEVTRPFTQFLNEERSLSMEKGEVIIFLLKEKTTTPLIETLKQLPQATTLILPRQKTVFPSQKGLTVSLIPFFGPAHGIHTEGLRWNLNGGTLDKYFVGLSNICLARTFAVSIEEGKLLVIINPDLIDLEMLP